MIFIDGPELSRRLVPAALIHALREGFRNMPAVPMRQRIDVGEGRELLLMPAIGREFAGVKLLTITPDNPSLGAPAVQGLYALFDVRSGRPVATMDADELTGRRTAALSALAADALARPDARHLLLIGSGHLITFMAEAHASVRAYSRITLWARDRERAMQAGQMLSRRLVRTVNVASSVSAAIAEADVICAATRATEPIIRGEWVRPGTHIDLVGGYRPDMREADDDAVRRGHLFVDSRPACLAEAGDIIAPIRSQAITADDIRGDIGDLARGARRTSAADITIFKAVGTAAADLFAAELAWNQGK